MLHQVPAYYSPEARTIVPTFQSGYVFNALAPSVVYEPKLAQSVYPNTIPVVGVNTRANDCSQCCINGDCKERNERDLSAAIDKKVKEQIEKYNAELERQARANCAECCAADLAKKQVVNAPPLALEPCLENMENLPCCEQARPKSPCCPGTMAVLKQEPSAQATNCKHCPYEADQILSLDEKIQMIRRNLNLPGNFIRQVSLANLRL